MHAAELRRPARFMFHQANLRVSDVDAIEVNGVTKKYSLLQAWTETVVQEMIRL
jgi:hypothetical protein